jgi:hypothetical protein
MECVCGYEYREASNNNKDGKTYPQIGDEPFDKLNGTFTIGNYQTEVELYACPRCKTIRWDY